VIENWEFGSRRLLSQLNAPHSQIPRVSLEQQIWEHFYEIIWGQNGVSTWIMNIVFLRTIPCRPCRMKALSSMAASNPLSTIITKFPQKKSCLIQDMNPRPSALLPTEPFRSAWPYNLQLKPRFVQVFKFHNPLLSTSTWTALWRIQNIILVNKQNKTIFHRTYMRMANKKANYFGRTLCKWYFTWKSWQFEELRKSVNQIIYF
jgi:hypothetical protein